MKNLTIQILPSVIFCLIMVIPSFSILKYYDYKNRKRKSPLNINFLRSPGQSLQEKINDLTNKLLENILFLPLIPILLYSHALTVYSLNSNKPSFFLLCLYAFIITLIVLYVSIKNYKILQKRNKLRLAYECEVAVGQDLQSCLIQGFKIFHDFPAENFNIDHIAIGPTGIYTIETKGRAKFAKAENNNWKVIFDGKFLIFPQWQEQEPIKQTKRQAVWLERWIKESTQEEIHVTPVLALPGWFIERKASSDILIYNGKNSDFLAKRSTVLTDKQIQNIAFQVEKQCRDVEGKAYKR